jgi:uncharacterized protein involved in type VI secretion and phage assembly
MLEPVPGVCGSASSTVEGPQGPFTDRLGRIEIEGRDRRQRWKKKK